MVGGTTASDSATCELKVMKRKSNSNSNLNPNPKSNPFLIRGRGMELGWRAGQCFRRYAFVCLAGIDNAAVVIDGMTVGFIYRLS
jgi:hypothetical protein